MDFKTVKSERDKLAREFFAKHNIKGIYIKIIYKAYQSLLEIFEQVFYNILKVNTKSGGAT